MQLQFWAMGSEGELVQRLLPEFVRRNPGVVVRVQQIPWSAAHEKLLTAYVAGTLPDVVQAGNTWIPELVAIGAIEPLDERLDTEGSRADFFPGILETNVIDDTVYGIPWYVDTRVLFYRKDLLTAAGVLQPPTTWAGWLDSMARVSHGSPSGRYAIFLPLNEWQLPAIFALQAGAEFLRDGDRYGNFRSAEFRRGFAFFIDLFRRGFAPFSGEAQIANVYQDFAAGFFTYYISGPWNLGEFRRRLPESLDQAWATAPLPAMDDLHDGVSTAGGASLALVRGTTRTDLAWKWIRFLTEPEQQVAFYALSGDLPSRRSAWDDPILRNDPRVGAFHRQLDHVRSTPRIPEWERIAALMTRYAEAAVRGEMSQEEALAALDSDTDAVLEKRRWLLDHRSVPGSRTVSGENR